ncbi:MAG: hypothetical protein JWQ38_473 [Flavipsychrobacter sp.]|nr:hypothetical protein [Flavipsychrobacter sp.]
MKNKAPAHDTKMWYYYLDNQQVVRRTLDVKKWIKYLPLRANWHLHDANGNAYISTVFLGVDYSFGKQKKPILFETMIFGGSRDVKCNDILV